MEWSTKVLAVARLEYGVVMPAGRPLSRRSADHDLRSQQSKPGIQAYIITYRCRREEYVDAPTTVERRHHGG
ncbi:unnamed protein product, partial [Iphiclides podalirius]